MIGKLPAPRKCCCPGHRLARTFAPPASVIGPKYQNPDHKAHCSLLLHPLLRLQPTHCTADKCIVHADSPRSPASCKPPFQRRAPSPLGDTGIAVQTTPDTAPSDGAEPAALQAVPRCSPSRREPPARRTRRCRRRQGGAAQSAGAAALIPQQKRQRSGREPAHGPSQTVLAPNRSRREVCVRRFDHEVIVIRHLAPAMAAPVEPLTQLAY